jgi:hypothetical protein
MTTIWRGLERKEVVSTTNAQRKRRGPVIQWPEKAIIRLSSEQMEATRELAASNGRSFAAEVRAALIAHHERQRSAARRDRDSEGPHATAKAG